MPTLYYVNVVIHVLAAIFWLGGMFFLGAVGAPALRAVEPRELRQRLFHDIGIRFRALGWWAIGALIVTGIVNLHYRGWLRWEGVLGSGAFWNTATGQALGVKVAAVSAMIALGAFHDFVIGPAAVRAAATGAASDALRRRAALVARWNAVIGVVVVVAAARLAR